MWGFAGYHRLEHNSDQPEAADIGHVNLHVNLHILNKPESYTTRVMMMVAGMLFWLFFNSHLIQENTFFIDFCAIF